MLRVTRVNNNFFNARPLRGCSEEICILYLARLPSCLVDSLILRVLLLWKTAAPYFHISFYNLSDVHRLIADCLVGNEFSYWNYTLELIELLFQG